MTSPRPSIESQQQQKTIIINMNENIHSNNATNSQENFGLVESSSRRRLQQHTQKRPKTMGKQRYDKTSLATKLNIRNEEDQKSLLYFSSLSPMSRMSQENFHTNSQPYVQIKETFRTVKKTPRAHKQEVILG